MEKRSHRRFRDLVAHPAFQGLDANEIGCVRISIMAGSNTLRSKGRIQMSETSHLQISHIQLATHCSKMLWVPTPRRCHLTSLSHVFDGMEIYGTIRHHANPWDGFLRAC